MPGAFVHIGVGLLSAVVLHFVHYKWEYSIALFVGNLLPDAIKFGFSAIKQLTLQVFYVEQDAFYDLLDKITSHPEHWMNATLLLFSILALLYRHKYIRKTKKEEYDLLATFLLLGVVIHLVLDALLIEKGPWY